MKNLHGIYAISDEKLTPYAIIKEQLLSACDDIVCFQLRDKSSDDLSLESWCVELGDICASFGVNFIINDRVELAIKMKSNGLHVGTKDNGELYSLDELKCIRDRFHGILGVSCYGDINLALQAKSIGANYVAFGACFKSQTKQNVQQINLDIFNKIEGISTCAIGGICANNAGMLKKASMIASISYIWNGDIKENLHKLRNSWEENG
ncbi:MULTISPECIES: thiamine phosphate synthase [Helicobacter]|uniref:Thiamine phosphate synthase n=1 Tax=Helicobacter ibis TaxID=2962633 RepID=A0ABT4VBZ8_9HELI|nr:MULTISPECIES: thiamine phosphate synthase [Helicobacter]MDA3967000.1 thiamine phosphate synthase [Helicobacter sp. WB40]MDA3968226.1 thiamine phosphate synthase [Helicobacter ibis]